MTLTYKLLQAMIFQLNNSIVLDGHPALGGMTRSHSAQMNE